MLTYFNFYANMMQKNATQKVPYVIALKIFPIALEKIAFLTGIELFNQGFTDRKYN